MKKSKKKGLGRGLTALFGDQKKEGTKIEKKKPKKFKGQYIRFAPQQISAKGKFR